MTCQDFRPLMQEAVDPPFSLAPSAERHLASCSVCNAWFEGIRRGVDQLRNLPDVPLPVDFSQTIGLSLARVRRERGAERRRLLAAVAMVLLSAWGGWLLRDQVLARLAPSGDSGDETPVQANPPAQVMPASLGR